MTSDRAFNVESSLAYSLLSNYPVNYWNIGVGQRLERGNLEATHLERVTKELNDNGEAAWMSAFELSQSLRGVENLLK